MSTRDDRAPLLLRLSVQLLPADVREEVLGDLLELWRAEVRHRLWARRVFWLFRQPLAAGISRLRFGGRGREGIGPASAGRFGASISWLDVKLGVRMVAKYPGLSLVSVLGMAVAIGIGAGVFGVIAAMRDPTLPLPGGDRIVAVQNNRADDPGNPDRQILHDLVEWRSELMTVRDLGAFRPTSRNLIIEGRGTELVDVAEMSAAGFRVARVPPLLGRPLLEDDERAGALPVLVIGYDEWQRRFDADPEIIGRSVRLGETVHAVVGVMPDGFHFPVNHGFWVPLRLDVTKYTHGDGPSMEVFGRLADSVTLERARAQLTAIGDRMASAYPDTHEHLRPVILPYAHARFDVNSPGIAWQVYTAQLAVSLLLVLIAANVAVLVYARTATRTGEIAVRTALGASRARVVAQLFVEALVLSLAAAAYGLILAGVALGWVQRMMTQEISGLPFWFDLGLSGGLIAYVAGLAILSAAIVGVLPALKATGRKAYSGLQQLAARGSQMRLGRTWTTLIVVQVGIAVAVLPTAIHSASGVVRIGMDDPGYPVEEFFSAWLSLEREEAPPSAEADAYQRAYEARFADRADALMRRLASDPGVGVSFASASHGGGESGRRFEIEDGVATQPEGRRGNPEPRTAQPTEVGEGAGSGRVGSQPATLDPTTPATREATVRTAFNAVAAGFFELYDAPILAGRGFDDADATEGSRTVIVDRTFAERMGDGSIVGRRIRDSNTEGAPWLEIVGVVADLERPSWGDEYSTLLPRVYRAATPGGIRALDGDQATSIYMIVRTRGGPPPMFTRRLRNIVASVEPGFQLHELRNIAEDRRADRRTLRTAAVGVAVAMLSVLLLSAAGIYAMLSFTVARRRREIGIRTALGADRRRILVGIFARAAAQLGVGVAVGVMLALALQWATHGGLMGYHSAGPALHDTFVLMPFVAATVTVVGLLAALVPARRGLAVQPTEALREE